MSVHGHTELILLLASNTSPHHPTATAVAAAAGFGEDPYCYCAAEYARAMLAA